MKDNKKIFYVLFAIIFLVLCISGSTYAYWAASTKSTTNSIETQSTKYNISMNLNPLYISDHLIPMDDNDVFKALLNKCKDNKDRGACYAYNIILSDYDASFGSITGTMDIKKNNIENISYMVLQLSDNNNEQECLEIEEENYCISQNITDTSKETNLPLGNEYLIDNNQQLKLILVIWLTNLNESQNNYDIGDFNATITFNLGNGGEIKGTISSAI